MALLSNDSLSDKDKGVDMSDKISDAFFAAIWKESEMVVGWIPEMNDQFEQVRTYLHNIDLSSQITAAIYSLCQPFERSF